MTRNRMSTPSLSTTGLCFIGISMILGLGWYCSGQASKPKPAKPKRLTNEELAERYPMLWGRMQRGGIERL